MASKGMPKDLTVEILARLPVKSLLRFKSLSKFYCALITSQIFITKHFHCSTKNPRLVIFGYHKFLAKPCISLLSDELSQTAIDLGLPFSETSNVPLNLGRPFPERSQPLIDLGLTFSEISELLIDLTIPEIPQPPIDLGQIFPELPFPQVSQPSMDLVLPIPKISQPPVDLDLPFPDKCVCDIVPYGPCDGIFCLYGTFLDSPIQLILWNPATKEVKVLPFPNQLPSEMELYTHGFGIDPKTNDFKVVSILMPVELPISFEILGETQMPSVEVYNLSTNSWRKINVTSPAFNFAHPISSCYLNGVYHWLPKNSQSIVCFEMSNEVFCNMKLPTVIEDYTNEHLIYCNVAVLNDCIAYVKEYSDHQHCRFEVWVMNEHGVEESWTKLFNFGPLLGLGKFQGFWKDGEILATGKDYGTLFSYNLDTQLRVLEFPVHGGPTIFPAFRYVESMVPLSVLVVE